MLIFQITVVRENQLTPAINSQNPLGTDGSSVFDYNYNAAFAPNKQHGGLFVRCQNRTEPSNPYNVGPSVIAFTSVAFSL
jgi:hypothetical protein